MIRPARPTFSVLRAALLGTTALVLCGPHLAFARVGVTSATDGDPRGRPPQEAERILRIGIDVQASEVITTGANDRAHLVFLDGTSLTVGPNAQLTIDKFVYDPNTKTGELAVNASKGVLRLVGGKISKTNPITITTPSSTIGIRGGITILSIQPTQTTSTFVFGDRMTVNGQGSTQNVTRPGSQVTTNVGAPPGPPVLAPPGALSGQMGQLEGTSGGSPPSNSGGGGGNNTGGNQGGGNADQRAQQFSQQNSGQGPSGGPQGPQGPGPGGPGNPNNNNLNANVLPGANQQVQDQQNQPKGNTTAPTITTQTIVSRGRFLVEPTFTEPSSFGPGNLTVTNVPANNQTLNPSTLTTQNGTTTLTVTSAGSPTRTLTSLPWQPGPNSFTASPDNTDFGPLTGLGYVSALGTVPGDAFAYVFQKRSAPNTKLGFFGGTPTTNAELPSTGFAAHTINSLTPTGLTTLPFAPSTAATLFTSSSFVSTSPLYSVFAYNPSTDTGGAFAVGQQLPTKNSGQLQATIAISGVYDSSSPHPAQSSYMGVYINQFVPETTNGSVAASGEFRGTYRVSADQKTAGYLQSAISTASTGVGNAIYGTAANNDPASFMVFTPDQVSGNVTVNGSNVITNVQTSRTTQASLDQQITLNAGNYTLNNSSYFSAAVAIQTTTPSTLGQSRTAQTLTGYVDGLVDSTDRSGNVTTRTIGNIPSGNTTNYATISLTTTPSTNSVDATITAPKWNGNGDTTATFRLGGGVALNSTSLFVDDGTYAARDVPSTLGTPTSVSKTVGNTTITSVAADLTSNTVLVSQGVAPVTTFLTQSGVTNVCDCKYLEWGFWGGSVSYAGNQTAGLNINPGGIDRINMATYVAGNTSSFNDINVSTISTNNGQQSTATYNGQLIGNVNNNGASYVAAGSYSNVWSFGSKTGALTVNYDGASFSGGTALVNNTPNFTSGNISSTGVTGRTLNLNGSFFNGVGNNTTALYQAGRFGVTNSGGTPYTAAGTFAAQRTP